MIMTNNEVVELEHKINDLEAKIRFYELIIVKEEREEELSYGQFVTVLQLLEKYKHYKNPVK
mgnify:CR=1 FL=1